MTAPPSFLDLADGRRIAYRHSAPRDRGRPTLFFLPGYASDMEGTKALAVEAFAADRGCGALRLDYSGTGSSSGAFADGTFERWLEEVLAAADQLTEGPLIVIGSSMGGWLMIHLALHRPHRVAALVGIAAAPDFTDWGFTEAEKHAIEMQGKLEQTNPYGPEQSVIHREFWRSGQARRVLDGPIAISAPVRLLQGDEDEEVPVQTALQLVDRLRSPHVQLLLVKGGGHRLSRPHEIDALLRLIAPLVETAA